MADFARSDSPAVQAQLDRLGPVSAAADRLGLERIRQLLERLGRPQDVLPPVFHVAGTNGKGSVCAFLRAGLEAAGHPVHVFTSPHLVRFNERIRIAGELVSDDELADLLEFVIDRAGGLDASFFEVATAAAILGFARAPAAATILEVGLGGRLDATNVVEQPAVCGVTALGLDHSQFLGSRLIDIAREKAAIAKRGVPLVVGKVVEEIGRVISEVADAAGAPVCSAPDDWHHGVADGRLEYQDAAGSVTLPLPELAGLHQGDNCALAVAMLRHQRAVEVPLRALERMPLDARWPARLQQLDQGPLTAGRAEVWLDGGHNAAAAEAIARFAQHRFTDGKPLHLIFASLTTKDPRAMLEPFAGIAAAVHTLPIRNHDCRSPEELSALAKEFGFPASSHEEIHEALALVPPDARILIFGSLYLAGEVLAANGQPPA